MSQEVEKYYHFANTITSPIDLSQLRKRIELAFPTTGVKGIAWTARDLWVTTSRELSQEEEEEIRKLILAYDAEVDETRPSGAGVVASHKEFIFCSHDYSNRSSWYANAVKKEAIITGKENGDWIVLEVPEGVFVDEKTIFSPPGCFDLKERDYRVTLKTVDGEDLTEFTSFPRRGEIRISRASADLGPEFLVSYWVPTENRFRIRKCKGAIQTTVRKINFRLPIGTSFESQGLKLCLRGVSMGRTIEKTFGSIYEVLSEVRAQNLKTIPPLSDRHRAILSASLDVEVVLDRDQDLLEVGFWDPEGGSYDQEVGFENLMPNEYPPQLRVTFEGEVVS